MQFHSTRSRFVILVGSIASVSMICLLSLAPVASADPKVTVVNQLSQVEHNATSLQAMYKTLGIDPLNAGAGIKVAVIDTGISVFPAGYAYTTNACFSDAGYAPQIQLGDTRFTNNKVIVARNFTDLTTDVVPVPDGASAQAAHGSHVAGIIGCNAQTSTTVNGTSTGTISGIAPKALFGSYVVAQSSDGLNETSITDNALANAIDQAVKDGMQIINISIGGSEDSVSMADVVNLAITRATKAGVLVVVAAGNEGPTMQTIDSPGIFPDALTVGSTDGGRRLMSLMSVNDGAENYSYEAGLIGLTSTDVKGRLVIAGSDLPDYIVYSCDNGDSLDAHTCKDNSGNIYSANQAPSLGNPSLACSPSDIGSNVVGAVAVVLRGTCSFYDKLTNLENAGAIGAVIVSGDGTDLTPLGSNQGTDTKIPAIMLPFSDLSNMVVDASNGSIADFAPNTLRMAGSVNQVSDYSSAGPSIISGLNKPDLVAPGANILSASFGKTQDCATTGTCFQIMSGTSMATPYVAGVATVLRQAHPKWSVEMLRSAIVNYANPKAITGADKNIPQETGVGLIDPLASATATIGFTDESLLFDNAKKGSVKIINSSNKAETLSLKANTTWITLPKSITIPANSTKTLNFKLNPKVDKGGGVYIITASTKKAVIRLIVRHRYASDVNYAVFHSL